MNISYSCNDGYIQQTGISMISLFENNKEVDEINVYFISKDVSEQNKLIIQDICHNYGRELKIFEFDNLAYDLELTSTGRHIETIYTKIFFSRIKELNKIIYIDSDTIITDSLKHLWEIDLDGYYMGMVETYTGGKAKQKLGMEPTSLFFNDGVALCNVSYCRKHDLTAKCLNLISKFHGNPPVLSEGVLNKVCEDKILKLSPKYNMMAGLYQLIKLDPKYVEDISHYEIDELMDSADKPIVIHYLSGFYNRPWNKECSHPLKSEFLKYKNLSPWKDTPLQDASLPKKLKLLGWLLTILGPYNFNKLRNIIKL